MDDASAMIEAYFTPPAAAAVAGRTLIVIDTLRATTVITTLIAGGAAAVYPCVSQTAARRLAAALPGSHLCGELGGLRPPDFEFGNSPSEFAAREVRGWTVVQSTSNGTPALALAAGAARTLVGCLRNRAAVAAAARREPHAIAVVCSGEVGSGKVYSGSGEATTPSVEDAFSAGAVVERLVALAGEGGTATPRLGPGARLVRRTFAAYGGSAQAAFADSPHAADLQRLGFEADLDFAAQLDATDCVPLASVDAEGRVVVRG